MITVTYREVEQARTLLYQELNDGRISSPDFLALSRSCDIMVTGLIPTLKENSNDSGNKGAIERARQGRRPLYSRRHGS